MNKYFEVAKSLSDMQKAYCYNKPNRKEALIEFNKKASEARLSLTLLAKEK